MCKNGPAVGGNVIPAVLMDDRRGLGGGFDAPLVCQPASVEGVSTKQTHGCDQNDDQRVHFFYLFPLLFMRQRGHAVAPLPENCVYFIPIFIICQYFSEQFRGCANSTENQAKNFR